MVVIWQEHAFMCDLTVSFVEEPAQLAEVVEYTDYISADGEDPHKWESWIWHETIWWWGSSPGALRNMEYPFIAIAPSSTLTRSYL